TPPSPCARASAASSAPAPTAASSPCSIAASSRAATAGSSSAPSPTAPASAPSSTSSAGGAAAPEAFPHAAHRRARPGPGLRCARLPVRQGDSMHSEAQAEAVRPGAVARAGAWLQRMVSRVVPDPFLLALGLTLVVMIGGLANLAATGADAAVGPVVYGWLEGFASGAGLAFAMQ